MPAPVTQNEATRKNTNVDCQKKTIENDVVCCPKCGSQQIQVLN
jgi:Zn finger protein HypA/HybF involved in hydrogenase expression